jgi:putative ABC transport system ATP-binding protein
MHERRDNPSETHLALQEVAVASNGVALLRDLSFELRSGEMLAVVGPSGCGKTTLLRTINQLIDAPAGTISLNGRRPEEVGYPQWRRQVILLDQRPVLLDETVEANLRRPFDYATAEQAFPAEQAATLLDELGVGRKRLSQGARSLSVGQQQRVCLIRALLLGPQVLLMDEPTSALDPESVQAVEKRVAHEVHEHGLAALVVTHDRGQIERLCDRHCDLKPHLIEGAAEHMLNAAGQEAAS